MDEFDLLRADPWAALLTLSALKGALLLGATGLATLALRRAAAATRHLVWTLAFAAVLLMPVLLVLVPGWEVPVLPADTFGLIDTQPVVQVLPSVAEGAPVLTEAARPLSAEGLLLGLWALGALLVGMRWLAAAAAAAVFTRHATPVTDPEWRRLTEGVRRTLGIRRPVALRVNHRLRSPMTWGVRRPVVLLPAEAAAWSDERRRVVLTHELAHVRRRDSLMQWLGQAVVAVYWFNPLAWHGYRRMLVEREHACDDYVLQNGALPSVYAGHLLQLARDLGRMPRAELAMASMARPSQIEERLHAILRDNQRRDALSRGLLVIVGVLVLALVWPVVAIDPIAAPAPPAAPLPPASPLPPPAPLAPAALSAVLPPAPPLPPVPAAAPAPAPAPDPRPVVVGAALGSEKRRLVEVSDPFSGASGPSAPSAFAVHVRTEARRAAPAPVTSGAQGDRCLTRLDAAFAYDMESATPPPRIDVSHLVEDGDAWDALDRQAEALTNRMSALARRAEHWETTTWTEREALHEFVELETQRLERNIAIDWKRDVDNRGTPTYRPDRRVTDECPDTTRQKARASW